MEHNYEVVFYQKDNGEIPVAEFLESLPKKDRAKCLRTIGLLSEFGIEMNEPHSKFIGKGLYELRSTVGNNTQRIFYFHFKNNCFYLLNGFTKKDRRTPNREITKATLYKKDIENRENL